MTSDLYARRGFASWVRHAYRDADEQTVFTYWQMEVAFSAGRNSAKPAPERSFWRWLWQVLTCRHDWRPYPGRYFKAQCARCEFLRKEPLGDTNLQDGRG